MREDTLFLLRGLAFFMLGDTRSAKNAYNKVLDMNGTSTVENRVAALLGKGRVYLYQRKFDRAEQFLQMARDVASLIETNQPLKKKLSGSKLRDHEITIFEAEILLNKGMVDRALLLASGSYSTICSLANGRLTKVPGNAIEAVIVAVKAAAKKDSSRLDKLMWLDTFGRQLKISVADKNEPQIKKVIWIVTYLEFLIKIKSFWFLYPVLWILYFIRKFYIRTYSSFT